MSSFTYNESFTITQARYLASKVATDLKRMQRFYLSPSDSQIADFEEEIALLLKHGYLESITFGFQKNGTYIKPTLKYTAAELTTGGTDDDPGRIPVGEDVSGASFYSYLVKSSKFSFVSEAEKERLLNEIPVKRVSAETPMYSGIMTNDKSYSSNNVSLNRFTLK